MQHSDLETTLRYFHINDNVVDESVENYGETLRKNIKQLQEED